MRETWDEYFMNMALLAASRGTCLRRKVGAIAVKDKRIICTGYNGPPPGIPHCDRRGGCYRELNNIPSGEALDKCYAVHAEENILIQAALHGVSLKGATLYVTNQPCFLCMKSIAGVGLGKIVYKDGYDSPQTKELLNYMHAKYAHISNMHHWMFPDRSI